MLKFQLAKIRNQRGEGPAEIPASRTSAGSSGEGVRRDRWPGRGVSTVLAIHLHPSVIPTGLVFLFTNASISLYKWRN